MLRRHCVALRYSHLLILLICLVIALLILFTPQASGDHSDLKLTTILPSSGTIEPGDSYHLPFNLTNTGEEPDRYLLSIDSQYDWETQLAFIKGKDEGQVDFIGENGDYFITEFLNSGEGYNITILVTIPDIGIYPGDMETESLEKEGLLAGTTSRITLVARTESDNFATGDEAQYEMRVRQVHDTRLIFPSEITIDPYGSRTEVVELNVTHISNNPHEGNGEAVIHLGIVHLDEGWDILLSENDFSLLPRTSRTISLSITLPEGVYSLDEPYYYSIVILGQNSLSEHGVSGILRAWLKQSGSVDVIREDTAEKNAIPGQSLTFNFTVMNTGNGPDRFFLHVSGDHPSWINFPDKVTGLLRPRESTSITVRVTIPIEDPSLNGTRSRITLTASSFVSPDYIDSGIATIIVDPYHALSIHPRYATKIYPPFIASIDIRVINAGNVKERFTFMIGQCVRYNGKNHTLTELEWGMTLNPTSLLLEPKEEGTLGVEVSAGGDYAYADKFEFRINGLMGEEIGAYTEVCVEVGLTSNVSLSCNVTTKEGKLGEKVGYLFGITNTGSGRDVFYLSSSVSQPWTDYIALKQISLEPHQTAYVHGIVVIPDHAPGGLCCVYTLTAGNERASASVSVTAIAGPTRRLELSSQNVTHHIFPGDSKKITVEVHNRGNVEDTVSVSAFTTSGWQANIIPRRIIIGAFSSRDVVIIITPSNLATTNDTMTFRIAANSEQPPSIMGGTNISVVLAIAKAVSPEPDPYFINDHLGFTAAFHGYSVRGGSIRYFLKVRNLDEAGQIITFQHSPSKLPITTPSTLSLRPGEEATISLTVTIPETANIGDYNAFLFITSQSGRRDRFNIVTTVIRMDLKIKAIELDRVLEGKETDIKVKVTLTGSGYEGIQDPEVLTFSNIEVELEFEDYHETRSIAKLKIDGTATLRFPFTPNQLKWYEKEKKIEIYARIVGSSSLIEGDDDPENNRMERQMIIHDAPPTGLVTNSLLAGLCLSILFLVGALHYFRGMEGHFNKHPTDPKRYPWRSFFMGAIAGLVLTLPMGNESAGILVTLAVFLAVVVTVVSSLESRDPKVGLMVPLLFFVPFIGIATLGSGLKGVEHAFIDSSTPVMVMHFLTGIIVGLTIYLWRQYSDSEVTEVPLEFIHPFFSSIIAWVLGLLYLLGPD
ncbi:MAG: hypothetical protein KAU14_06855, partial [Thermoplasmata archaeon]|nr:hypothetical protein [Thermoplasmata archaeon]